MKSVSTPPPTNSYGYPYAKIKTLIHNDCKNWNYRASKKRMGNFYDVGLGKYFLDIILKTQSKKEQANMTSSK